MTLRFEGGALVMRKADGTIKFNTNEGLFHGTNWFASQFGLPAYVARTSNVGGEQTFPNLVDTSTDAEIQVCDPGCTHVFGFMRATRSGGQVASHMNGVWKDASGTQVDGWSSLDNRTNPTAGDAGTFRHYMGSMTLHTFYVSGARLRFKERIMMRASTAPSGSTVELHRPAVTVEYQLLTGYFL